MSNNGTLAFAATAAVVAGALLYTGSQRAAKAKAAAAKAQADAEAAAAKLHAGLVHGTPRKPLEQKQEEHDFHVHHDYSQAHFGTRVIHVGQEPDPTTGAVAVPISLASTFAQKSPGVVYGEDHPHSYYVGYEYSRTGNPTRAAFEQAVASAESGKYAVAFSSGSAATSAVVHLLPAGSHVISIDDVYGGTQRYFKRLVEKNSTIQFSFVDLGTDGELEKNIRPNTKLIWMETPTNPTLKIADIKKIAAIAKANNILLAVDNTFMSSYFQRPLELGADIVINSVTKFVNGHSDVVMGFAATRSKQIWTDLRFVQNGVGAVPSPFDCYLALRGLKTLHVRMERHAENAMALAKYLEAHEMVERVIYPGLPSHKQHAIAKAQMHGFGAMITFYVAGGLEGARAFLENLEVFTLAESLGAVESLAESPAIMTHASVPKVRRVELGIDDNLIRLSVGIEHIEDLLTDIAGALAAVKRRIA